MLSDDFYSESNIMDNVYSVFFILILHTFDLTSL